MIRQLWLYTLQSTQFVVTTLTAYFVLRIRTAHSLYFGAGTLVAAFTAKILKRFIRQPRPVGAKKFDKTYGMPSTHSSSIAFFGTYLSLSSLLLPLHPRVTTLLPFWNRFSTLAATLGPGAAQSSFWRHMAGEWGQRVTRISLALFFLAGTASVCWSRVRLGHHTKAQVIAGASLGSMIALAWMTLWLGLDGWSTLSGKDLERVVAGFAGGAGKAIPTWLIHGVKEPAMVWERAAEDAAFVALEAWETRRWEGLKELRDFPLTRRGAGGEL
ncbi:hypothetical protein JCM10296v2_002925 [Rhodotorula toruloides]